MKNFRQLLPVLPNIVITALVFFLLQSWKPGTSEFAMLLILYIPLYCMSGSLIYGLKNGFHYLYPLFILLAFCPILYTVIGWRSLLLSAAYSLLALIGVFLGGRITKHRNK
ncbi:MAG: hypothetical protein PWP16_14 [Eubacteriaceae bacterium]|jgi:hypothetical protein|nr:hypothetical protein [Eubacteriaceae bacterium]MDK2935631.1 hypothetical protein [Eubacteriaceae bacterium]MDN5306651.1 hypothetical protein [Eubacteriaceae bacterium]